MGTVVPFRRVTGKVSIGGLRCEGCGAAAPFIFAPGLPVRAWCSPACAAAGGLMPWAGCGAEDRERWDVAPRAAASEVAPRAALPALPARPARPEGAA